MVLLAVAAIYFVSRAADREGYHFFDNVDLVIHEAGHVLISPFGEFLGMAGGTILQLAVPLVFAAYFFVRDERLSAGFVMFWLGQSFINVARYAGDAIVMELPLIGGGIHDWNYLLSATGLLRQTVFISDIFYYTGVGIIISAIIIGVIALAKEKQADGL